MSTIDRIKAHFSDLGTKSIEVPEWGEEGKPLVIYFTPMTIAEQQQVRNAADRDGAVSANVDLLVLKALDAEGKKVFTIEHKLLLRKQADARVVRRIADAIFFGAGVEEMGKDSSGTTASD